MPAIRGKHIEMKALSVYFRGKSPPGPRKTQARARTEIGDHNMNTKSRLLVGIMTALAMMALTYALPRGGALRDAALVQFPMTAGIWAIFVLLFVKLK
jgi:hypothetical protein